MAVESATVPLGDLYEFGSGLSKSRSAFGRGYPFLSFKDIFYNSAVPRQLAELVDSSETERSRCSVRRGDVFLTRTSETVDELGMSCVALHDVPDATFNGFTKRLRPRDEREVVPEYARYFFRSPSFRAAVTAMSSMSTRASLNNEMLARLAMTLPSADEQSAIGHILGTLDDKIELNRCRNATLEAMAWALFKAWFVDFEPVRAKLEGRWQRGQSLPGLPAHLHHLFPDRLAEAELGEIPEGWRIGKFWQVVRQIKEPVNPGDSPATLFAHYSLPAFDGGHSPVIESGEAIKSNKWRVAPDTVLLSKLNPEIDRTWLVDISGDAQAICSTEFLVLVARKPFARSFVYSLARSEDFRRQLESLVTGTSKSHQRAQPAAVMEMDLVLPPEAILTAFEHFASGWFTRVQANRRESRTLATLRDTLLPKLISGELRLSEATRLLEEVA